MLSSIAFRGTQIECIHPSGRTFVYANAVGRVLGVARIWSSWRRIRSDPDLRRYVGKRVFIDVRYAINLAGRREPSELRDALIAFLCEIRPERQFPANYDGANVLSTCMTMVARLPGPWTVDGCTLEHQNLPLTVVFRRDVTVTDIPQLEQRHLLCIDPYWNAPEIIVGVVAVLMHQLAVPSGPETFSTYAFHAPNHWGVHKRPVLLGD
jgi:hypothetical protein